jgi:transposase-like protein
MTLTSTIPDISIGKVPEKAAPSREGAETGRSNQPDPEVPAKTPRRSFTAEYKLRILRELDTCTEQGQKGALLRREGLYSSNVTRWREQLDKGLLHGLGQKRGRKPKKNVPEKKRIDELERENAKLRDQLKKAETIIDVQKKISEALGIPQNSNDKDDRS